MNNMSAADGRQETDRESVLFTDATSPSLDNSEIKRFFSGANIFLTGGTGFLGKVLIEKLLRCCSDLNRLYILVRPKKGKPIQTRIEEQFDDPLYDVLKKQQPNFNTKVTLVPGDASCLNMGISNEDKQTLVREINIVFHVAATVRFDEKIKHAVAVNVRCTRDMLKLAKEMHNLKSFMYISTAYSNCVIKEIDEKFYEAPISWEKLIDMTESLDEDLLNRMTPALVGDYPNTYAYTKSVSESVVKDLSKGLPVAMVRPAIVISTYKEPIVGWIDNIYGPTGVVLGAALGLMHSLHADKTIIAELIPVDNVVNAVIAAAWFTSCQKENDENIGDHTNSGSDDISIYNYVSSEEMPITWGEFMKMVEKYAPEVPSDKIVWTYCFVINKFRILHLICTFLMHTIPAYIVDSILYCLGKQPMLVKGYQKIHKFSAVISYFSTQQWKFSNKNTKLLFQRLNRDDKAIFDFDMSNLSWDHFFQTYVKGLRLYLLKDPLETIPIGAKKMFRLKILHYSLCTLLTYLLCRFLWSLGCFLIGFF